MRGIVAQIEGKYAVVLSRDGSFRKVKAKPYMKTGIEIDMDQPAGKIQNTKFIMKVTSIAAAALLTLGTGYGAYCYTVPYSYVHLDINPSIELTANIFDRIIKAEALNEDGFKLLEGRNLKNTDIETGVSDLLDIAVEKGFLTENDFQAGDIGSGAAGGSDADGEGTNAAGVNQQDQDIDNTVLLTIASSSSKKSGELKKEIMDLASKELDIEKVDTEILVGETSIEQRNEARELGITPGKLALIEDALTGEPGLQLNDLKKKSVKQILDKIKEKEKNAKKNKAGTDSEIKVQNDQNRTTYTGDTAQEENTAAVENQADGTVGSNARQLVPDGAEENDKAEQGVQGNGKEAGGQDKSQQGNLNKSRKEDAVKPGKEAGNQKQPENKAGQVKSGNISGSGIKGDVAKFKNKGKNESELKLEREKLKKDLLDQMKKQQEARSKKSVGNPKKPARK